MASDISQYPWGFLYRRRNDDSNQNIADIVIAEKRAPKAIMKTITVWLKTKIQFLLQ